MWMYCYCHWSYHLVRFFPFQNRTAIRALLIIASVLQLLPQLIIIADPKNSRDCDSNLLDLILVILVLTVCVVGFTVIFTIMEPVPWQVRWVFHVYGGVNAIVQLVINAKTFRSADNYCKSTVPDLYNYLLTLGVIGSIISVFYILVLPFWVINKFRKNSVYNASTRQGICWPFVNTFDCIWHV